MTEIPMALEICLCGDCANQGHQKEVYRPLTAEEMIQRQVDAEAFAAQRAAEEMAAAEKAAARAALLARLGLTEEEAALLLS